MISSSFQALPFSRFKDALQYGRARTCKGLFILLLSAANVAHAQSFPASNSRERININSGWTFMRYTGEADQLIYDERPKDYNRKDDVVADSRPSQAVFKGSSETVLKKWILPTANEFIKDPAKHYARPAGQPGSTNPFVQKNFDDNNWEHVDLPHDWASKGPFYTEANAIVGGGMGRLPIQGVAWYRKKVNIPTADRGKSIYLELDGAMSYAMVWLNGHLVGGWPYGYNSFRLDLTPYVQFGGNNQIAIRLDNPPNSARWYPGSGLYRSVWLSKTNPVQIAHWGTSIRTSDVSKASAKLRLKVAVDNKAAGSADIKVLTDVYRLSENLRPGQKIGSFPVSSLQIPKQGKRSVETELLINQPALWRPLPTQKPNMYVAVTRLIAAGKQVDSYETRFGIRDLKFDAERGLIVNGEPVRIQGVNQHHDLGALGAAFNYRAAERQLEMLQELGCNAIRLSHNPPAPELLELTDKMGFLVIDEVFDCWEQGKTALDFHLIFPEWHEADIRSFIRRDKNHPSIIAWSFGNEVGEQYTEAKGAKLAQELHAIVNDEDPTRPATASMNYAKPEMPFPATLDLLSLNYQGEGIRDAPEYAHLTGIKTPPLYTAFHEKFPNKMIVSSETASTLSTRGTYVFPVTPGSSAPVSDSTGGDRQKQQVSAYELYTAAFGASPDKVFAAQDKNPFVSGEFVWTGWDYLGEPTPYYGARSSYSGMIDLAGFKKDRFYLYQARWRPELKFAHILPHWTWPGRAGQITPVHVFSSADEAELFLNGRSLGRKKRGPYEYRFRWDQVKYEPGDLQVRTYKNGQLWATETVKTAGQAYQLELIADRKVIKADGSDLAFITVRVLDQNGNLVPMANDEISFSVRGAAEIVATDNGDPADLRAFPSKQRKAFSGMALVIVRAKDQAAGEMVVSAEAAGLVKASLIVKSEK